MEARVRVESLLIDIESELRALRLWSAEAPTAEALASTEPFCLDTLAFHEWLQFVLLPRLRVLLAAEARLPHASGIAPMAEETFRETALPVQALLDALAELDAVLSRLHRPG